MMAKVIERGRGPNPWRVAGWSLAALLLLLPVIAMQFTREVNWTPFDFAFAAVMIGGVGIAFELTVRATRNNAYRSGFAIALAAAFLLIWMNGAVVRHRGGQASGSRLSAIRLPTGGWHALNIRGLISVAGSLQRTFRDELTVDLFADKLGTHALDIAQDDHRYI